MRAHAAALGLRTADKPESMDVCFITQGGRVEFLDQRVAVRAGDVVDTTGAVLGTHDGIATFTIGQRRGVGVALGERRYVVDVDARAATVTLGITRRPAARSRARARSHASSTPHPMAARLHAQVRAHGEPVVGDARRQRRCASRTPQPRVAPGQVVALYDGDALVGGGIAA